jgi:hypothetical protein
MDLEASVSAIVFHHPSAIYYKVGGVSEQICNRIYELKD